MGLDMEGIPPLRISLWDLWTEGQNTLCFRNARSAFAHFLRSRALDCVYLPAYTCPTMQEAVLAAGARCCFYSCGPRLEPDFDFLHSLPAEEKQHRLLVVNTHFGRPLPPDISAKVSALVRKKNICCIEDRAQALHTRASATGDFILYSPRKLVGVSDGGILTSLTDLEEPLRPAKTNIGSVHAHTLARLEQPERNPKQYAQYKRSEERMGIDMQPMSALTKALLQRISYFLPALERAWNWRTLHRLLGDLCLWDIPKPVWAPLGFPVLVQNPLKIQAYLRKKHIYCSVHWQPLPAPRERAFAVDHALSAHMLTLPCDHRYDYDTMTHLADMLRIALRVCR